MGCSRWDVGFGERAGDPIVDAASPSNNEIEMSVCRHLSPGFLVECSLPPGYEKQFAGELNGISDRNRSIRLQAFGGVPAQMAVDGIGMISATLRLMT